MWRFLFLILLFILSETAFSRDIRHMTTPQKIQLLQNYIKKNFNAQHAELLEWNKTGGYPVPKLPMKLKRAYLHQIKLLKSFAEEVRHADSKKSLRSVTLARGYEGLLKRHEIAQQRELEKIKTGESLAPIPEKKGGSFEVGFRILALPIVAELSDATSSEKIISRFTAAGISAGYSGGDNILYRVQGSYIFGVGNVVGEAFDYNQERAIVSGILLDLQLGYALGKSLEAFVGPTFRSLSLKTQESAIDVKEAGSKIMPSLELRYVTDGAYFSASSIIGDGVGFGLSAGFRF